MTEVRRHIQPTGLIAPLLVALAFATCLGAPGFAPIEQACAASDTPYESSFAFGTLDGYAAVASPVGGAYHGGLLATQRNGYGTYLWPNGDSYAGNWIDDTMSGQGVYTFANGATLSGTFENDFFATGTYTAKSGANSYVLKLKDGVPYQAKIKTAKKFSYSGSFGNGKLNGKGTAHYRKGGKYTGSFASGKRSGKGTYAWKNGAKYTGKWKKDKMQGKGTYYYPKSSKAKKLSGTFSSNKPKGTCKYYLRSGKTYSTVWKNGKCVKVK